MTTESGLTMPSRGIGFFEKYLTVWGILCIGSGMGQGPALALLLAGPALSLPSMLVLRSILGTTKMLVYVALVIAMATASGLIYGALFR
jgi:hypothetical protein